MNDTPSEPNPFESPEADPALLPDETDRPLPGDAYIAFLRAAGLSILLIVGLYFVSPGVSLIALFILVPANLRSALRLRREFRATGQWPKGGAQATAFFISTLIMVPLLIAAGIAFFAVCWAGAMIAVNAFPKADDYGFTNMLLGGVPAGLIAALVAFVLVFRLTLPTATRRDTPVENVADRPQSMD
ncbi:hypothetical protein ACYFX5_04940 [Bremerella sp. T1]|uniref:hypothetical protein n=1 Tax=Bremerella sp. TYQ1 TaxID=3119568 RepID=UPI001CC90D49|nr:hypothetical protein [Bremerella volcania]UBM37610.1 hypothetical protein LA756_06895 [Bremerella volcania]